MATRVTMPQYRINLSLVLAGGLVVALLVQGEAGWRILGLWLRLDQAVLFSMAPVGAIVLVRRGSARYHNWAVRLFVAGMLSIMVISAAKPVGQYAAWNQFKNVVLVVASSYLVTAAVLRAPQRIEWVLRAVVLGTVGSIVFVLSGLDLSGGLVRPMSDAAFRETTGVSFLWLGLAGGMGLLACLQLIRVASAAWRITAYGALIPCGVGLLVGGSRSVIYVLVIVPVVVAAVRRMKSGYLRAAVLVFVSILVLVSLAPSALIQLLPTSDVAANSAGTRLSDAGALLIDAQARISDWDRMLYDRSPGAVLFGGDWDSAIARSVVLSHPHNVFVWLQLLWGLVGNLVFSAAYGMMLYYSLVAQRLSPPEYLSWARALFAGHLLILGVLTTNSWVWGSQQLLGIWCALTVFTYRHLRAHSPLHQARRSGAGPETRAAPSRVPS